MKAMKPRLRVYRKLSPGFASDYIRTVRLLSRKHRSDHADEVKRILRVLNSMSQESFLAGRGEVWIPEPSTRTGYYPMIEKIPYTLVRRAIRGNTGDTERAKTWSAIAATAEPFLPLFASPPGSLNRAQRKRFLSHLLISLPIVKGRTPALLGKMTPGELDVGDIGTRSIIPIHRMSPEDWERGFTMKKFSLSEDLTKAVARMAKKKPVAQVPQLHPPKIDLKEILKRATDTNVKLEPEPAQNTYLLTFADRMCYEDGFREWLRSTKRKTSRIWRKTTRWLKREAVPVVARNVTLGLAGLAHTELGLQPTTIDMLPVQRVGLNQKLQMFPSSMLRAIVEGLQQDLVSETDKSIMKGLERGIGEISTELKVRGVLL